MNFDINTMMNLMSVMKSFGSGAKRNNENGCAPSANKQNDSNPHKNGEIDFFGRRNYSTDNTNSEQVSENFSPNNRQRNFDLTTIAKLLPLLMGNQSGSDGNLLGMISALSGVQNVPSQKQENTDLPNMNKNAQAVKTNPHGEKPRNTYDEIPFAGDEVVYFLRKMRILSSKTKSKSDVFG